MVGAVGFEPTTPGPKPGALPGCAMLRFIFKEIGVNDGIRTRDNWNHNPGLYQLSYIHHQCLVLLYQATKKWRA